MGSFQFCRSSLPPGASVPGGSEANRERAPDSEPSTMDTHLLQDSGYLCRGPAGASLGRVKRGASALVGWFRWLEHLPIHQNVGGSIPSQVTYLGCMFNSWSRCVWEATNQCFSLTLILLSLPLPLFLPLFPSL